MTGNPTPPFGTSAVGPERRSPLARIRRHRLLAASIVLFLVFDAAILAVAAGSTSRPTQPVRLGQQIPLPQASQAPSEQRPSATTRPTPAARPVGQPGPATSTAVPTTTSAPTMCTAADLTITTTTDHAQYAAGQPVTVRTVAEDVAPCIFDPHPAGPYDCAVSSAIISSDGTEAYPAPGQSEQCSEPSATTLSPGATVAVSLVWPASSPGTYTAVALWSWDSENADNPHTAYVGSDPFTVQ